MLATSWRNYQIFDSLNRILWVEKYLKEESYWQQNKNVCILLPLIKQFCSNRVRLLTSVRSLFFISISNIQYIKFPCLPSPQFLHESRLSEAYSQQRQAGRQAHKRWHAEVSSDVVSIKFHFVFLNWNERKGCQCSMTHLFSTRLSIVNHD